MNQLQQLMLDALVDVARTSDAEPIGAMGAAMGSAIQFTILVSEVAGRNTLADLYYTRRELTRIINQYKEDNARV